LICTRLLVTAFLFSRNDLLMMHRSTSARFLPGLWAPIGGHIEADEYCLPQAACEREILEETGLTARDMDNLSLRCIVHRIWQSEIRIQFYYFGSTTKRELAATDEGELQWVPFDDVPNLAISATLDSRSSIMSRSVRIRILSILDQLARKIVTHV
jgi:8-oxo-dGTP diphosphatase